MRVGYGRVSTHDQNPDGQRDALTAAGCDELYIDKASGKLASRPELDKALIVAARSGDQLVITKLDRLVCADRLVERACNVAGLVAALETGAERSARVLY